MIYICFLWGAASHSESALMKSPWNLDTAITSLLSCVRRYEGFIALAGQYLGQWQKCWEFQSCFTIASFTDFHIYMKPTLFRLTSERLSQLPQVASDLHMYTGSGIQPTHHR